MCLIQKNAVNKQLSQFNPSCQTQHSCSHPQSTPLEQGKKKKSNKWKVSRRRGKGREKGKMKKNKKIKYKRDSDSASGTNKSSCSPLPQFFPAYMAKCDATWYGISLQPIIVSSPSCAPPNFLFTFNLLTDGAA